MSKINNNHQILLTEASSLLLVTALCGAGGALTTTANAAVVATPGISPATPLLVPATTAGVYINVVTGVHSSNPSAVPGWDLNPFSTNALSFFSPSNLGSVGSMLGSPTSSLQVGTLVDATGAYASVAAVFGSNPGQWTLNASNYFGFRFRNESNNQIHFGWGRMDVGATALVRSVAELYYEDTPGAAISVVAVPEPTGALLAAGAVGLMALRRRRQAAA
jgi:hypothetical protein